MSFEVGEHGDIMTGGFSLASPMSATATSIYGCLLEAVTCTAVRKAKERTGDSGDGIGVQRKFIPSLAFFKWAVLGSYDFVVSIVGLPSKKSPVVVIGRVREGLGSSRVRMKNNKDSQKERGKGSPWRPHGLGSGHRIMGFVPGDLILSVTVPPLPLQAFCSENIETFMGNTVGIFLH